MVNSFSLLHNRGCFHSRFDQATYTNMPLSVYSAKKMVLLFHNVSIVKLKRVMNQ